MDSNAHDTAGHYPALRAQCIHLRTRHGKPVAVNYQSGGNVAYATWITEAAEGMRLLGYDLSSVHGATLSFDLPLTYLGSTQGSPEWSEYADRMPIDSGADILTYWDNDATDEYRDGTYSTHNTATGLTAVYGVGVAL